MNAHSNETEVGQHALAISIWEDEGGAPAPDTTDHQYGRRIEADRSWTVYHVFTGVPARIGGNTMVGLSRSGATEGMLSLNRRNIERWKERVSLSAPARPASCETEAR
ncbi:hypothetical protein PYH37_000791 [Sinorhizobium numidicum]|uniref:Uncharacterized protein n=2 Tax=Sinorhizobium numidicum TaxID=680248 RepID=A0ABY8CSZ3_9HYPH|nr:hypothetical protein [Sinorhizobium numidicum]WEX75780.1 hypothetical protein PYH37_000791 [Sinorhizobium numidicum]WEX81764.1 hypothetical protein PYH38_000792 [Sinorhizobium numidicum]